jgi:ankyrin repeat protein
MPRTPENRRQKRRLTGLGLLPFLLVGAAIGQARATEFELIRGKDFALCQDMAENLKAYPDLLPVPFDMPFDSRLVVFRWITWEPLDPLQHEAALRQAVINDGSFRGELTAEEQEALWRQQGPALLEKARAGKVALQRAEFDVNQDGKRERVYRFTDDRYAWPSTYGPTGTTHAWKLLVLPEDGPKASRQLSPHGRKSLAPFTYEGRIFFFDATGPTVLEPKEVRQKLYPAPVCEFKADEASAAEFRTLLEENARKRVREERQSDLAFLHQALDQGGDADRRDIKGRTLLQIATHWNRREEVEVLLRRGADPNLCGPPLACPVFLAAQGDTEILRALVAAGADVNVLETRFRHSALGWVAEIRPAVTEHLIKARRYIGPVPDALESARILIAAGADVNHVNSSGESPLRTAMRLNNLDMAMLLLESGADVHQRIGDDALRSEGTILMETIWWYSLFKDLDAIALLLDHGADPNDRNGLRYNPYCDTTTEGPCRWRAYSVLTFAARRGWSDVVRLLLERGADPTLPRGDGTTALEIAEAEGHSDTARLLREYCPAARQ